nr:EOG090X07KN [Macrothrix elegans]
MRVGYLSFYLLSLIVSILLLQTFAASENGGYCTKDGCEGDEEGVNPNSEGSSADWTELKRKIVEAVSSYEPCKLQNCSCYTDLVKTDLETFKNGITQSMIDDARPRGTKYQIIGHKLYREKDCMFPSRCSGIQHFIKKVIDQLPDMEFIVNTRDWPQTPDYLDITYPAWTFWEGGPAISLYPQGLGRWDLLRKTLDTAAAAHPWNEKIPKAFFRGSRTSAERDPLILLSREQPDLVEAQYTKNQAWKSDKVNI